MIPRRHHVEALRGLLARHPVVAILGARQVGKSTLARQVGRHYRGVVTDFDLENDEDLARLEGEAAHRLEEGIGVGLAALGVVVPAKDQVGQV